MEKKTHEKAKNVLHTKTNTHSHDNNECKKSKIITIKMCVGACAWTENNAKYKAVCVCGA